MSLSAAEKLAGRHFLAEQARELATLWSLDPGVAKAPPFLANFRHECPGRPLHTQSLHLNEVYITSPELWVCYCGEAGPSETIPHEDCDGGVKVPAGRFAFIYQDGKCPDCRMRVRSGTGRLVDGQERPPLEEKKAHA